MRLRPVAGRNASRGGLRSTATARATLPTLPAVSIASTVTVRRPSRTRAPNATARSGAWSHGAIRVKSQVGRTAWISAPSTSTRSCRIPTGSLAAKLSGASTVRQPGAVSAPRATTLGGASSRTVMIEPEMKTPANGKPWSFAVAQPGSLKHETEYRTSFVSRSRSTRAAAAMPGAPKSQESCCPTAMLHVSPNSGPPITVLSPR